MENRFDEYEIAPCVATYTNPGRCEQTVHAYETEIECRRALAVCAFGGGQMLWTLYGRRNGEAEAIADRATEELALDLFYSITGVRLEPSGKRAFHAISTQAPLPSLDGSELATVLHALRVVQEARNGIKSGCLYATQCEADASCCDHFDDAPALTDKQIDDLCERLNQEVDCVNATSPELVPKLWIVAVKDESGLSSIIADTRRAAYLRIIENEESSATFNELERLEAFVDAEDYSGFETYLQCDMTDANGEYAVREITLPTPELTPTIIANPKIKPHCPKCDQETTVTIQVDAYANFTMSGWNEKGEQIANFQEQPEVSTFDDRSYICDKCGHEERRDASFMSGEAE